MKPSKCRNRRVRCAECGYTAWQTRSWMLQGLLSCPCGGELEPTEPSDLAFIGRVTAEDMGQAAWNAICRENGWPIVLNQGQASRRLAGQVLGSASKPQCAYPGCGRWVSSGSEHCSEHAPVLAPF